MKANMRRTWANLKPAARLGLLAGLLSLTLLVLIAVLAILPAVSPSTGVAVADWIRSVVGPRPVAALEGESLTLQDAFNRLVASRGSGQPAISLAHASPVLASQAGPQARLRTLGSVKPAAPVNGLAVVTDAPQIGWRPFGPSLNGAPAMAESLLALDPQRAYAGIALVRVDLTKLQLHMMPGYTEPSHASAVLSAIPHIGQVPGADQARLLAAFNGGFKAVNGHYGMMVNGVTLLPPVPGIATLAIYKDGHVAMGTWGTDIGPSPDMVAFRQNCPPILQAGQINPQVYVNSQALWGETIGNKTISWRTGVGLTQDGRYLIYAVGNGTSIQLLAEALQKAGAYNAMQLDINRPFAHFVTYQPAASSSGTVTVSPLLDQMEVDPRLYLVPHYRDFFYLTTP